MHTFGDEEKSPSRLRKLENFQGIINKTMPSVKIMDCKTVSDSPLEKRKFCNTPLKRKKGELSRGKPGEDGLCWRHTQRQGDVDQPIGGKFRVTETMGELRAIAKEEGVKGYSRKNKMDLVWLIESETGRKFKRREIITRKQLKATARRMGIKNRVPFPRLCNTFLSPKQAPVLACLNL